jgi:putative transposase
MRRFAGARRFVFNKALALQQTNRAAGGKWLSYAALCKELTGWRHSAETPWLAQAPSQALQQALKDLGRAYTNFFARRAAFPSFKRKGLGDSFRYPAPEQIKFDQANSRIFLPKLGWIGYRNSRHALGDLRNVTVSLSAGKWFISVQTQREVVQPLPAPGAGAVGIDLGIARFATLSGGTFLAPINSFKKHLWALLKAQRALSRKKKFSCNWKKAKVRVQRIHTRIANCRRDYLHKATTTLSKNHAVVVVEDLQVRNNMSRSAAGTTESPGRNVKAKSGLNKAILDQGWGEFRRQLGVQAGVERRHVARGAGAVHQPDLPAVRARRQGQPADPGDVCLRRLQLPRERRRCRRAERVSARTSRHGLWRAGAVRPLDEAGTHRSDYA